MEFITTNETTIYDKEPYILIDVSGSTSNECKITNDKETILDAEKSIASSMFQNCRGVIIFWSDKTNPFFDVNIKQFLQETQIKSDGTTLLNPSLCIVKDDLIKNKKQNKDIYIFTDGEIHDKNAINESLANLYAEKINIYIITFENNDKNYDEKNCHAGNTLYSHLNENNKMNFIKKITQYNNFHKTGYVALNNFDVPEGYYPFKESIFSTSKLTNFLEYIEKEINQTEDEILLFKISYDLARTMFYITKDKTSNIKHMIVNRISSYFKNTIIYSQVRTLLLNEIDNHINHKSSTFQDYKSKRDNLFENTQLKLLRDVKNNTSKIYVDEYISFPIETDNGIYIFKCDQEQISESIQINKLNFDFSCFAFDNFTIPVFPSDIILDEEYDQCLRQWTRAIYSKVHNLNVTSNKVLIVFLFDCFYVSLSESLSKEIQNGYRKMALVMLNAKIYGTNKTIIESLCEKNIIPSFYYFNYLINKHGLEISLETVWSKILLFLAQEDIYNKNQNQEIKGLIKWNECIFKKNNWSISENIQEINNNAHVKLKIQNKLFLNEISQVTLVSNSDVNLIKIDDIVFNASKYNIKNIVVSDVLNNMCVNTKTKNDFIKKVEKLYPFLLELDMKNVCLAGGFVRAILLEQKMKDFDFFLYGLQDKEYESRTIKLIKDLIKIIKQHDVNKDNINEKKYKFLYIYKPQYNVFEIIYIYDPTNHLNEKFDLDNFAEYKFSTLRRFKKGTDKDEKFFEEGDEKGIKMIHRFQIIMCKFNSISAILDSFDLAPSCVAFDGTEVYFTKDGMDAYKYMVNLVRKNKYTDLFEHRVSKYLSYGFDICFEDNVNIMNNFTNKYIKDMKLYLGDLAFQIKKIDKNKIIIKHNSHKKDLFDRFEELEQKALDKGKTGLYMSSLFCSLVSIMRYICINNLEYCISDDILEIEENIFNFRNNKIKIDFIEKIGEFETIKWFE
jgi:hypothetical protein